MHAHAKHKTEGIIVSLNNTPIHIELYHIIHSDVNLIGLGRRDPLTRMPFTDGEFIRTPERGNAFPVIGRPGMRT